MKQKIKKIIGGIVLIGIFVLGWINQIKAEDLSHKVFALDALAGQDTQVYTDKLLPSQPIFFLMVTPDKKELKFNTITDVDGIARETIFGHNLQKSGYYQIAFSLDGNNFSEFSKFEVFTNSLSTSSSYLKINQKDSFFAVEIFLRDQFNNPVENNKIIIKNQSDLGVIIDFDNEFSNQQGIIRLKIKSNKNKGKALFEIIDPVSGKLIGDKFALDFSSLKKVNLFSYLGANLKNIMDLNISNNTNNEVIADSDNSSNNQEENSLSEFVNIVDTVTADNNENKILTDNNLPLSLPATNKITSFKVLVDPEVVIDKPISVYIEALNEKGEIQSDYDGTIFFESSDTTALLPMNYSFNPSLDKGRRRFSLSLVFKKKGLQSLIVKDINNNNISWIQENIKVLSENNGEKLTTPVINYPLNKTVLNISNFTLEGTTDPLLFVDIFNGSEKIAETQADETGSFFYEFEEMYDGMYTIVAIARDIVGGESDPSTKLNFSIDTSKPIIENNEVIVNDRNPYVDDELIISIKSEENLSLAKVNINRLSAILKRDILNKKIYSGKIKAPSTVGEFDVDIILTDDANNEVEYNGLTTIKTCERINLGEAINISKSKLTIGEMFLVQTFFSEEIEKVVLYLEGENIDKQEIVLKTKDNMNFETEIKAPDTEGIYFITGYIVDKKGKQFNFTDKKEIEVSNITVDFILNKKEFMFLEDINTNISLSAEINKVQLFLKNEQGESVEIPLEKKSDIDYQASFFAPKVEGLFSLNLVLTDEKGKEFNYEKLQTFQVVAPPKIYVSYQITEDQISLNWQNSLKNVAYFKFYYGLDKNLGIESTKIEANNQEFTLNNLKSFTNYFVKLVAFDNNNQQLTTSNLLEIKTKAKTPDINVYKVVAGDSLISLGKKFGLDWREIALLNNIEYPYLLSIGQELYLMTEKETLEIPKIKTMPIYPGKTIIDSGINVKIYGWIIWIMLLCWMGWKYREKIIKQ